MDNITNQDKIRFAVTVWTEIKATIDSINERTAGTGISAFYPKKIQIDAGKTINLYDSAELEAIRIENGST